MIIALLLLFLSLPLYSSFYQSNELGMALMPIASLSNAGWEMECEENCRKIFHDGQLYRTIEETDSLYEEKGEGFLHTIAYDEKGQRTFEHLEEDGKVQDSAYFYDEDGHLTESSLSENGTLIRRQTYELTDSGKLAYSEGDGSLYFWPRCFVYEAEDGLVRITYHPNGHESREDLMQEKADYTVLEDGRWKEIRQRDGVEEERIYSATGLLLSSIIRTPEKTEEMTAYTYDEKGQKTKEERIQGNDSIVDYFENGFLKEHEEYKDDQLLLKSYQDEKDRRVEIRYRDGKACYQLLYDLDGVRILEVKRL